MSLKKIILKSFFTFLCLCIEFFCTIQSSFAFEQNYFEVIPTRFNESISFYDNYTKLKNIAENINQKIKNQEYAYKNTNYKQAKIYFSEAKKLLDQAEIAFNLEDSKKARSFIDIAINKLKDSQLNLIPSRVAEARGLYIDADSIPKTKEEISNLIKLIKKANFNIIYPEVFRRGYSMVVNNITEIDPAFKTIDFDVLRFIIEEAHKVGIEVHPWFWCFRVKSPTYGNPILSKYSELIATKEKLLPTDREPLFLSPADPQARELIASIIKYFASNYDIDGVLMDYIRYDEIINEDTISKKYFRLYYLDKYAKEPPQDIPRGEPIFTEWQMWRENQVTKAVTLIKKEVQSIKPDIYIGASVFRTEVEGRLIKMQDWRLWDNKLLVKYICPMLYTNNKEDLNNWINSETDRNIRNDYLYASLGAHKFLTSEDIYPQYGVLFNRNVLGLNIFALAYLPKQSFEDLSKGIFRTPAIIPHKNPIKSIKLILTELSKWMKIVQKEEISLPDQELKEFIYKVDILKKSLPDKSNSFKDYNKLYDSLDELKKISAENKKEELFPNFLTQEIDEKLNYALKVLKICLKEESAKGKKFYQTLPPLPILKETKELPSASVIPISAPPITNENIDMSIWNKIEPLRSFYWHSGYSKSEVETIVKLAYGIDNLYILFENYEPKMGKIKKNTNEDNSWQIFNDDFDEVFLNISGINEDYRFTINPNNSKLYQKNGKMGEDINWDTIIKTYDNKWVLGIKIPFKDINFKPQNGSMLKANFVRHRPQELNPYSHWSPTYGSPDNFFRFGSIIFK